MEKVKWIFNEIYLTRDLDDSILNEPTEEDKIYEEALKEYEK